MKKGGTKEKDEVKVWEPSTEQVNKFEDFLQQFVEEKQGGTREWDGKIIKVEPHLGYKGNVQQTQNQAMEAFGAVSLHFRGGLSYIAVKLDYTNDICKEHGNVILLDKFRILEKKVWARDYGRRKGMEQTFNKQ